MRRTRRPRSSSAPRRKCARSQRELQEREAEIDRFRKESRAPARRDPERGAQGGGPRSPREGTPEATQELREAEARGNRLLEQSRHQATELTNSARAEVEQTLEWARAQAGAVIGASAEGRRAAACSGRPRRARVDAGRGLDPHGERARVRTCGNARAAPAARPDSGARARVVVPARVTHRRRDRTAGHARRAASACAAGLRTARDSTSIRAADVRGSRFG